MILLEGSFASGRIGLLESLDKLEDRWLRQRQKELAGAIRDAVRLKDESRATQLYEEKRNSEPASAVPVRDDGERVSPSPPVSVQCPEFIGRAL